MPSRNPQVRAIEVEASRRAAADGQTSKAERFAIRNELRAGAGLKPEKRQRGGVAGAYDRNKEWVAPAALLAAPFVLPALGGALGLGGGAAAGGAAPAAAAAAPAATTATAPFSLAGLAGKVKAGVGALGKVAGSKGGQMALTALQGVNAARQQANANRTMQAQLARENAAYDAAAPLRLAGINGMTAPAMPNLDALRAAQARASNLAPNLAAPLPLRGMP